MRKDSSKEEVTALDKTRVVLNVRIPKCMHRITVERSKKGLGLLVSVFCGVGSTYASDNPDYRAD
jgi:hypothetical protein